MISVPASEYGFLLVAGYRPGLMERALGVMRLPCGMHIEWLEVDGASGLTIILGTYDHSVSPRDRFANWDGLDYTKCHVLIEAILYHVLPMQGNRDGGVVSYWFSGFINHKSQGSYIH